MEIDRTDRSILALLSKNARISNKELAARIGLSPSTAHERLKRLYASGLVAGAHADVRLDALGFELRALLFVQMTEHQKANLETFVAGALQIAEVQAAWMITGRFDALVEIVARDTRHLHRVVVEKFSSRPAIHRIETSIIFDGARRSEIADTLNLID